MNYVKRVVIDTGTLISAAIRVHSVPSLAYQKALRYYEICISEQTFYELATVLMREKFDKYLNREDRERFVADYKSIAVVYDVSYTVNDCRDSNDNMFLELALSAKADVIISSDPDLYSMNPYQNIPIVQPVYFLQNIDDIREHIKQQGISESMIPDAIDRARKK